MINFSLFCETRYAPLYHGTSSIDNVQKILKGGKIKPSANGRTSLTRDKRYAETTHGQGEAYFHVNQETLRHRQHIHPTDWNMGGSIPDKHHEDDLRDPNGARRSESEESVKGHIDLKHVHKITIHKKRWDEMHAPESDYEKEAAHSIKSKDDMAWLHKGNTYKDRKKYTNTLKKNLKKHNIAIEVKHY